MTKNIVKAMEETRVKKLIFISSIGIYDKPEKGSVISQKSSATFIAKIIESPEKYSHENLGINKPNS